MATSGTAGHAEGGALTDSYTRTVLAISVLGPVEVRRAGELVPIPAGKSSELLVRLALEAGVGGPRPIGSSTICGVPKRSTPAATPLQSKVVRLRRALGDPSVIVSGDGGYRLAVGCVDGRRTRRARASRRGDGVGRRRRRSRRRRGVRLGASAVPWRAASRGRRRRMGRAAPSPARGGAAAA